ncbi:DUF3168 domain-containing protein [Sphingosinicella sp. BN140058]|uniref:tail completion protein gp17 n=1 Tax=Sphingosinicella sp. BN140058 TaxID=1892855 RepID=UPI001012B7A1|nr:DUF3168 domain-containing protein [Sphingosinicella sp. BN140058]QAY77922.1 DUF3168 domain-containing protein [Sphingosinicella sp. BN140058]
MADMQSALRARLIAAAPVAAIVAPFAPAGATPTKAVFWGLRPQGSGLPALVLTIVTGSRPQHLKGFQSLRATTVQIDAWADDFDTAKALIEVAIAAVLQPGTFAGIKFGRATDIGEPRALGEQTSTDYLHRQSVDLTIWHYAQED